MKKIFQKIYSASNKNALLKTAVIVFDTSALLQLYRYSKDTRKETLKAIELCSDRLFMPFQVGLEFYKNRDTVIREEEKELQTLLSYSEETVQKGLKLIRSDVSIFTDLIKEHGKRLGEALEKKSKEKESFSGKDSVLTFLERVFENKTGDAPINKLALCKEGKERYEHRISPGYKDEKKQDNLYGDYFIWHEIMQYAKKNNEDIVFISNDQKNDWTENGKLKPELILEFSANTSRTIQYYTLQEFVKEQTKITKDVLPKEVTNELKRWDESIKTLSEINRNFTESMAAMIKLHEPIQSIKSLNSLSDSIQKINVGLGLVKPFWMSNAGLRLSAGIGEDEKEEK